MKAFLWQGLSTVLAAVLAGPSLSGADREQSRSSEFGDFGEVSLQREAAELKLKLEEGKTYRWDIEARPRQQSPGAASSREEKSGSERSQAAGGSMVCKHQTEAKVTKASGDEATINFTFDASRCEFCKQQASKTGQKPPEKLTYSARVSKRGEVLSFEEEGGGGGGQGNEWKGMLMTQARQFVGEGLHEGRLEPGKTYDVIWMRPESWQKGAGDRVKSSSSSGESSTTRGATGGESTGAAARATTRGESSGAGGFRFELKYDGRTRLEGTQVTCFTSRSTGGSSSGAGSRAGAGESSSTEGSSSGARSIDGNTGGSGGEAGKACFRLDDGLLERFALVLPASLMKEIHKDEGKSEAGAMPPGDMLIKIRRAQ